VAGSGDIVTAGAGSDEIVVGDWITRGAAAEILDYNEQEDRIIIVYDELAQDTPDITLEPDATDEDLTHVLLGGQSIVSVHSDIGLNLDDLLVMTQSDAATFFGS